MSTSLRDLDRWEGACLDCGGPTRLNLEDGGHLRVVHLDVAWSEMVALAPAGKLRHAAAGDGTRARCNPGLTVRVRPLAEVYLRPACGRCRRILEHGER